MADYVEDVTALGEAALEDVTETAAPLPVLSAWRSPGCWPCPSPTGTAGR